MGRRKSLQILDDPLHRGGGMDNPRGWWLRVGPPNECCEEQPELEVEQHQGIVVPLRLTCPCGRETRIELDYSS